MTPEQRRARAYAAQALLKDDTLNAAFDDIEDDLRAQWEACWFARKRNRIWIELRTVKALRRKLASFAGQARE